MTDDILKKYLKEIPAFLALLRAVEAGFYREIELPDPMLDLGCGDGRFGTLALQHPIRAGIDNEWRVVQEANKRTAYLTVAQGQGARLPFANEYFASAVSNSVLEHIPDIDPALRDLSRVLQSGATFAFCVPSEYFVSFLSVSRVLRRIGLSALARRYETFFNYISRHHHCDSPETWQHRLDIAGFDVERYWYYFSPRALQALEWGHYLGVPALLAKAITRRWIVAPSDANLWLTDKIVRRYFELSLPTIGAYLFFIARKR